MLHRFFRLLRNQKSMTIKTDHDFIVIRISKSFLEKRAVVDSAAREVFYKFQHAGSGDWGGVISFPEGKATASHIDSLLRTLATIPTTDP